jgi:hypothetical protein
VLSARELHSVPKPFVLDTNLFGDGDTAVSSSAALYSLTLVCCFLLQLLTGLWNILLVKLINKLPVF